MCVHIHTYLPLLLQLSESLILVAFHIFKLDISLVDVVGQLQLSLVREREREREGGREREREGEREREREGGRVITSCCSVICFSMCDLSSNGICM
jgi:hypothetical protein